MSTPQVNGIHPNGCNEQSVLVTGGAGYIGSHTCVELINYGYNVVVVDNLCNSNIECINMIKKVTGKNLIFYKVDLLDEDALKQVFSNHTFSCVLHFAGLKAVGESCSHPLSYYINNLIGTINLLQVMDSHNVHSIVFSSSATVYGHPKILPISERLEAGKCTNPYGRTKYMIEEIISDQCTANKNWKAILLRYFNPVGSHKSGLMGEDPRGIPNNLMPYIAQVAVGRRSHLNVFGTDYNTVDGTGVRDYIHITDLALGHLAALKYLEENNSLCEIYNLGTGKGYSVLEIVNAFEKACGKKIPCVMTNRRDGDVECLYADPSLALIKLGWKAKRDLDEMCVDSWRWQSTHPNGFGS